MTRNYSHKRSIAAISSAAVVFGTLGFMQTANAASAYGSYGDSDGDHTPSVYKVQITALLEGLTASGNQVDINQYDYPTNFGTIFSLPLNAADQNPYNPHKGLFFLTSLDTSLTNGDNMVASLDVDPVFTQATLEIGSISIKGIPLRVNRPTALLRTADFGASEGESSYGDYDPCSCSTFNYKPAYIGFEVTYNDFPVSNPNVVPSTVPSSAPNVAKLTLFNAISSEGSSNGSPCETPYDEIMLRDVKITLISPQPPQDVPEPTTTFGLAALGLGWMLRRRSRTNNS